jgi:hypothetical protein
MITVERRLQIRSKKIVAYTKFTGYTFRTDGQRESVKKLIDEKKYTGQLKFGAKKRLAKAIDLLVQSTTRTWVTNPATGKQYPFQIGFTTLTVHSPDRNIDAKEAYKNLLGPFLQWLRRSHNTYLYIWKAELQTRGQIHYHLLLGNYVDKKAIRKKWNELQQQHGYLDQYYKVKGHYNAPSTEIKNALKHEDVAGYLIKEISKSIQNQTALNGKVWDCSSNLKEVAFFDLSAEKYAPNIANLVRQNKITIAYSDSSCTVYKAKDFKPITMMDGLDRFCYKEHIAYMQQSEILRPKKLKPVKQPPPIPLQAQDFESINITLADRYDLFNAPNMDVWGTALCAKLAINLIAN